MVVEKLLVGVVWTAVLLIITVQSLAVVKLVQAFPVGMLFAGQRLMLHGSLHDVAPPAQEGNVGQLFRQVGLGVGAGFPPG